MSIANAKLAARDGDTETYVHAHAKTASAITSKSFMPFGRASLMPELRPGSVA